MQIRIFWPTQRLMPCTEQWQAFSDNVKLKTDAGLTVTSSQTAQEPSEKYATKKVLQGAWDLPSESSNFAVKWFI